MENFNQNQTDLGDYTLYRGGFTASLSPFTAWILFGCTVAWGVYNLIIYPRCISPFRSLPLAKGGYPFIGHALLRFQQPLGQGYLQFMNETPNDGIILFRGLFNKDHLLLTSPDAIADVLVRKTYQFHKPLEVRRFIRRIVGDGMLSVEGDIHKHQRRVVTPHYTLRNTKRLIPTFWCKAQELVDKIRADIHVQMRMSGRVDGSHAAAGIVDMNHWGTRLALDIFGLTGLGLDLRTMHKSYDPISEAYAAAFRPTMRKMFLFSALSCGLGGLIDRVPWNVDTQFAGATGYIRSFLLGAVQRRRRGEKPVHVEVEDMMSKMMESGNFSDEEVVDQFLSFFAAGHETLAGTIGWAIYALATSPSIQTRLREELRAHITPDTDPTTLSDILESLPILNGVCNETIRLYPAIPVTPRIASLNTTIGDVAVPPGTEIMISPRAINRAQHLWGERAEEFLPERWFDPETGVLNRTGGAESRYAELSFLHGPHGCIGSGFARAQFRTVLAAFVGALQVELVGEKEEIMPRGRLATRPGDEEGKLMVRVRVVG